MTNTLTKVKAFQFNALTCDIYSDGSEFFMTREQIGRALEYSSPRIAITKIHDRHAKRLNPLSTVTKLVSTDMKMYDTIVYTPKGIYEICRWSQKPKADAFMDAVWDTIEAIRKGQALKLPTAPPVITAPPVLTFPKYGQVEPLHPHFYLAVFLAAYLPRRNDGRARVDEVYYEYTMWCADRHRSPVSRMELNRALVIYKHTILYNLETGEYEVDGVYLALHNALPCFTV